MMLERIKFNTRQPILQYEANYKKTTTIKKLFPVNIPTLTHINIRAFSTSRDTKSFLEALVEIPRDIGNSPKIQIKTARVERKLIHSLVTPIR
jgi:hypothetical protein